MSLMSWHGGISAHWAWSLWKISCVDGCVWWQVHYAADKSITKGCNDQVDDIALKQIMNDTAERVRKKYPARGDWCVNGSWWLKHPSERKLLEIILQRWRTKSGFGQQMSWGSAIKNLTLTLQCQERCLHILTQWIGINRCLIPQGQCYFSYRSSTPDTGAKKVRTVNGLVQEFKKWYSSRQTLVEIAQKG